jgi:hypothetical protein
MPRSKSRRKATKPHAGRHTRRPQTTPQAAIGLIEFADGSKSITAYSAGASLVDPDALYHAKTLDKEWFRSHPRRSHRLRRAIAGELGQSATSDTYVIVRQLKPGVRERISFTALQPLPEGDAPEHIAHAFFDLLRESPDGVIRWDKLAARMHAYESGGRAEDDSEKSPTVH